MEPNSGDTSTKAMVASQHGHAVLEARRKLKEHKVRARQLIVAVAAKLQEKEVEIIKVKEMTTSRQQDICIPTTSFQ